MPIRWNRPRDPHQVPFLLRGWIENVPELREAWNDPLAEWWRENQMGQGGARKALVLPIWLLMVAVWTVLYFYLLPQMVGRLLGRPYFPNVTSYLVVLAALSSPRLFFAIRNTVLGTRKAMAFGYATPIQESLFGDVRQRQRWWEVPLPGERVARLVMLAQAQQIHARLTAAVTIGLVVVAIPISFKLWLGAVLVFWTVFCIICGFVIFTPTPGILAASVLKQNLVFASRRPVPIGSPVDRVSKEEDGVLADQVPVLLGVVVLTGVLWLGGVVLSVSLFISSALPPVLWLILPPVMGLCVLGLSRLRKASLHHVRIRLGGACARLAAAWDHFRASTDDENWRALTDKPYGFPS